MVTTIATTSPRGSLSLLKRAFLLNALFYFTSCSPVSACPKWTCVKIATPCLQSERWVFPSLPNNTGLTLEYTLYPSSGRFFLRLPLPYVKEREIDIYFNDSLVVKGTVFEGGEKVALPESINEFLLQATQCGEKIIIRALGWNLELS